MADNSGVLIIVETKEGRPTPASLDLLAFGNALSQESKHPLYASVFGSADSSTSENVATMVDRVYAVENPSFDEFQGRWRACLVIVAGGPVGTEHPIESAVTTIGRDADATVCCDDDTMSREHAAVEFAGGGLRVRDLGSRNGVRVNGSEVRAADLVSGDRLQVGSHVFQLVLEERKREPKVWVVPED